MKKVLRSASWLLTSVVVSGYVRVYHWTISAVEISIAAINLHGLHPGVLKRLMTIASV